MSCRLKVRSLLWPTTAAVCFVVNSSCWEACFHAQTQSQTAAVTHCTSSIPTSPSGTSPLWQETNPPLAQGKTALFKRHLSGLVFTDSFILFCVSLSVTLHVWCKRGRSMSLVGGTLLYATMTCTCWTLVRPTHACTYNIYIICKHTGMYTCLTCTIYISTFLCF